MIYVVDLYDSVELPDDQLDAYFRSVDGAVAEARAWVGRGYTTATTTVEHEGSTYYATRYIGRDGSTTAVVWHTPVDTDVAPSGPEPLSAIDRLLAEHPLDS